MTHIDIASPCYVMVAVINAELRRSFAPKAPLRLSSAPLQTSFLFFTINTFSNLFFFLFELKLFEFNCELNFFTIFFFFLIFYKKLYYKNNHYDLIEFQQQERMKQNEEKSIINKINNNGQKERLHVFFYRKSV